MKCSHCGTDLPPNAKYCPNCAEPVIIPKTESKSERLSRYSKEYVRKIFIISPFLGFTIWLICAIILMVFIDDNRFAFHSFIIALIGVIIYISIKLLTYFSQSPHQRNIAGQFEDNRTSICPKCGCHSITIYRKGYDWNGAFLGSILKIRGSRYLAGMNSNDGICRCDNCGHEWDSGYNYSYVKQQRK